MLKDEIKKKKLILKNYQSETRIKFDRKKNLE